MPSVPQVDLNAHSSVALFGPRIYFGHQKSLTRVHTCVFIEANCRTAASRGHFLTHVFDIELPGSCLCTCKVYELSTTAKNVGYSGEVMLLFSYAEVMLYVIRSSSYKVVK
jgi:hypothetical protein